MKFGLIVGRKSVLGITLIILNGSILAIHSAENVEMVFCYHNCFDILWEKKCSCDREELLKFEAEGREFAKFFRSLRKFI